MSEFDIDAAIAGHNHDATRREKGLPPQGEPMTHTQEPLESQKCPKNILPHQRCPMCGNYGDNPSHLFSSGQLPGEPSPSAIAGPCEEGTCPSAKALKYLEDHPEASSAYAQGQAASAKEAQEIMASLVLIRKASRNLLFRFGIISNPAWSDQEVAEALSRISKPKPEEEKPL